MRAHGQKYEYGKCHLSNATVIMIHFEIIQIEALQWPVLLHALRVMAYITHIEMGVSAR